LTRAVFSFAVASASLATLFFLLASPFAAVLELTVGAGLIVVLFLVALTLSMGEEKEVAEGGET
jgi:NADH:ubiquinone oxidoreductase subunit 6 (subunit J)